MRKSRTAMFASAASIAAFTIGVVSAVSASAVSNSSVGNYENMITKPAPGCGNNSAVHSPVKGYQVTPSDVNFKPDDPLLNRAAAQHVKWVDVLSCTPRQKRTVLPSNTVIEPPGYATAPNWSGYYSSLLYPQQAEMYWNAPNGGPHNNNGTSSYASVWPGIGGQGGAGELIQAGTDSVSACGSTSIFGNCINQYWDYYFWVELYPGTYNYRLTGISFKPGDQIATAISFNYSTKAAGFEVCNFTQNVCGDLSTQSPTPGNGAEWIIERPSSSSGSLLPLANYGTVTVTGASTAGQTIAGTGRSTPLNMTNTAKTYNLSTVGILNPTGNGFTATWHNYQ